MQYNRQPEEPRYVAPTDTATATLDESSKQTAPGEPAEATSWINGTPTVLAQGLVFGFVFGFLLQKGGVAKFDILVGQLLLENYTVVKVMLSAVVVGMAGVYLLNRVGLVEYQIKETVLGSNIIGGLLFGVGFGLLAYCPGTTAAAVGQGNLDAIVGIVGMIVGSYLFALSSNSLANTVSTWGNFGKLTLPELFRLSRGPFTAIFIPLLIGVLVLVQLFLGV